MATIKVTSIAEPTKSNSKFTYTDLRLDLEFDYTRNNEFLKRKEIRDLKLDYDYAAIRNSIFNLFNTVPGQKILNPYFGLNLIQYLFQPLSEAIAEDIGNRILKGINTFEPRINVSNITVAVDETNQQYIVKMVISVPSVDATSSFKLAGTLNNTGFNFVNT